MINIESRFIVVIFNRFTTEEAKYETYEHELRHIIDKICTYLGIGDFETLALLSGYIGKHLHLGFDRKINWNYEQTEKK